MDYSALWREISTDPAGVGYAGKTDAEIAGAVNANTRPILRSSISGGELIECTKLSELAALDNIRSLAYWGLTGLGSIDIEAASNTRQILLQLFPAGSVTRDNLAAFVQTPVLTSRAAILGLGTVYAGHVWKARAQGGG